MAARKARINPRRVRKTLTWSIDLDEGSVSMRRADLMNEVLLGHLPEETIRQVHAFEKMAQAQGLDVESTAKAVEALPASERLDVITMLRRYACVAIVDPVYVPTDDGNPDHVPADTLGMNDLMRIWNAVPPTDVDVDPDQPLAKPTSEVEAARFSEPDAGPVSSAEGIASVVPDGDPLVSDVGRVEGSTVRTTDSGAVVDFAHG